MTDRRTTVCHDQSGTLYLGSVNANRVETAADLPQPTAYYLASNIYFCVSWYGKSPVERRLPSSHAYVRLNSPLTESAFSQYNCLWVNSDAACKVPSRSHAVKWEAKGTATASKARGEVVVGRLWKQEVMHLITGSGIISFVM